MSGDETFDRAATAAIDAAGNVLIGWAGYTLEQHPDGYSIRTGMLLTRLLRAGTDPEADWEPPVVHFMGAQPSGSRCMIDARATDRGFEIEYYTCGESTPDGMSRGPWRRRLDLDGSWSEPAEVVDADDERAPESGTPGEYLLTLGEREPWPQLRLAQVDERGEPQVLETLASEPRGEIALRGGVVDRWGRNVLVWVESEGPKATTVQSGACNPPDGSPAEGCVTTTTFSHARVYSVLVGPDGEATVVPLPEMQRQPEGTDSFGD